MKKILTFAFVAFLSMPAFAMDGAHHAKDAMMEHATPAMDTATEHMADKADAMMMDKEMVVKPSVYVAAFHADWCGSCKELGPKLMSAVGGFKATQMQLVKLDLTDDKTSATSMETAKAHQWGDIYSQYAPKTGFALIIDAKTNEVLSKITKDMSTDDIKAEVQKNI